MSELESQIAKIQLGNLKRTNTYVFTMAEKATGSDAELYVVAELPMLSPAAYESCEKICLAVAGTLKRIYKRSLEETSFENAIAEINEELGKLASLGQTHWIDKLNGIVAVKNNNALTISTTGKVAAYLVRNGKFTGISCSLEKPHPLKTFENYATGRIRLSDVVILSTTQLFNFLSIDKLKSLLESVEFLTAVQSIIEILKQNAGPETAFGALLNLQVPLGQTSEERVDLQNFLVETEQKQPGFFDKAFNFVKAALALDGRKKTAAAPDIIKTNLKQRFKKFYFNLKNIFHKSTNAAKLVKQGFQSGKQRLDLQNFKNFSTQKKFFLFSVAILALALVVNLVISINLRNNKKTQAEFKEKLQVAENFISDAESAMLYKDADSAKNFLQEAASSLPEKNDKISDENIKMLAQTSAKLENIKQKLEKNITVEAEIISTLGDADKLIILPGQVAAQINGQILSYNLETKQITDGELKTTEEIKAQTLLNDGTAVIYNGLGLMIWDPDSGKTGTKFYQNVPGEEFFSGLGVYAPNNRVYAVDKEAGEVISFLVTSNQLARPLVSASSQTQDLKTAVDIAVDGNIYILSESSGITKYYSGKLAEFKEPGLVAPLSGQGKLYTEDKFENLYVLDAGNNRIVILTPEGEVVKTITSPSFTDLRDFYVNEKTGEIYILNDSALLKINIP